MRYVVALALVGIVCALGLTAVYCGAQPQPAPAKPSAPEVVASHKVHVESLIGMTDPKAHQVVMGMATKVDHSTGAVTYTVYMGGACDGQPTPELRDQIMTQINDLNPKAAVNFERAPHIMATHATFIEPCEKAVPHIR